MNYWSKVEWRFRKSNVVKLHYMNFNMKSSNISYFYHLTVKLAKLMLIRHKRGLLDCFLDTLIEIPTNY
jgi:hypothetical protein